MGNIKLKLFKSTLLSSQMESKSNLQVHTEMAKLDQKGKIIAEYIWIDGSLSLRAKARTLDGKITSVDQLPDWNFDGSSRYMAPTENSEVIMKPVAFYPDPFRGGDNILVLTETYDLGRPHLQKVGTSQNQFQKSS